MPVQTDGQWTGAQPFILPAPTVEDGDGHQFSDTRGLFVLHAVLLHTGKVLCFSGHVESNLYAPLSYLFDPKNSGAAIAPKAFPPGTDLFCCHYVQIPDGRVLAMGGSQHDVGFPRSPGYVYRGSTGSQSIGFFDPVTESWAASRNGAAVNDLQQGRWYPTPVLLSDGRVAVFSGRRESDNQGLPPTGVNYPYVADMVEILAQGSGGPDDWRSTECVLTGGTKNLPTYPGMHLAPNGRIYFTHCNWGQELPNPDTASILIQNGRSNAAWTTYAGLSPPRPRREEGTSVLLPPAQDGRILVVGGGLAVDVSGKPILDRTGRGPLDPIGPQIFDHVVNSADSHAADILDTRTDPPTWANAGNTAFGRTNGHCVLLPDATVLICGGQDIYKWQSTAGGTTPSLTAEIYTPGSGFRTVAAMHAPRRYHSVALLLPDGRVFTAGGADPDQVEPPPLNPPWAANVLANYPPGWRGRVGFAGPLNARNYEIYEPPYLFNGTRPEIGDVLRNGAPTRRIEYGQSFVVNTAQAASIDTVVFIRPGACTHHTDSGQRYVPLKITAKGSSTIDVTAIDDAKVAPPGYYMLWIVDSSKRPCKEAVFVRLVPKVGQPGGGTSCFIATAALGSADHPHVRYLQALREELRASGTTGHGFIAAVTRGYESFSPWVAEKIREDAALRQAVARFIVCPVATIVRASDSACRWLPWPGVRFTALTVLLAVDLLLGTGGLPLLLVMVAVSTARYRRRMCARVGS